MTDRSCPHCLETLPEPVPEKCPYCGESVVPVAVASPLRRVMSLLPAMLFALSPLILSADTSLESDVFGFFVVLLLALIPFTLIYGVAWALSYVNTTGRRGMHWVLLAFLVVVLNYGLGFGGCFAVALGKDSL